MKYMSKHLKRLILVLFLVFLCSCSTTTNEEIEANSDNLVINSIGVLTGSVYDETAKNDFPNVNVLYFNTRAELILALKTEKVDGIYFDEFLARPLTKSDNELEMHAKDPEFEDAFVFPKGRDDLRKEFNQFLKDFEASGKAKKLFDKWVNEDSTNYTVEPKPLTGKRGTLNACTSVELYPFVFMINNELSGYEYELFNEFCYEYDYDYVLSSGTFDTVISSIASGKSDIGFASVTITDERKENMDFSDPICDPFGASLITLKTNSTNELEYENYKDLNGKKIGCMSGSIFDSLIKELFPDSEVIYFNSRAELLLGLKSYKIDAFLSDRSISLIHMYENPEIGITPDSVGKDVMGFCFSDDALPILNEFNEYLTKIKNNGFMDKLKEKWIRGEANTITLDDYTLTGEKGTINACTTVDASPFVFKSGNEFEGYEVELLTSFCEEYGYNLKIDASSFDALISAIAEGKYDICFNGIYITEERKKQVDFSDEEFTDEVVCVVRKKNVENKKTFFEGLKDKMYRTFIEEERYKLIFDGILTTLTITVSSLFLGTFFGFILFFISRKSISIVKSVIDGFAYVISGLPVVVLLMIMFYIIFSKSTLSGTIISIIAFTLIIGNTVYGLLKTGVDAIDKGQFEGAYALGYTESQTMMKFIIPQALRIVMPSYKNEIVSLIKSSSVVGYVTVQDLTRVSDIIRSRTYDAFFPLIVTAIIYFVLAWLLSKVADKLQSKFLASQKTKEEILKSLNQEIK